MTEVTEWCSSVEWDASITGPMICNSDFAGIYAFSTAPENNLVAQKGSVCLTTTGVYYKTTDCSSTGWVGPL